MMKEILLRGICYLPYFVACPKIGDVHFKSAL